jgi:hypothetical protein
VTCSRRATDGCGRRPLMNPCGHVGTLLKSRRCWRPGALARAGSREDSAPRASGEDAKMGPGARNLPGTYETSTGIAHSLVRSQGSGRTPGLLGGDPDSWGIEHDRVTKDH